MKSLLLGALVALPMTLATNMAFALGVGEKAPCVELNHIAPNGTESVHCIRQPNVEGQFKILEFFQTTCGDCMMNLPNMTELALRTDKVATTRLIGLDRNEKALRDYVNSHGGALHFEVGLDMNREATQAYDVKVTPTIFVLAPDNKVVYRKDDILTAADVQEIEHLVGAQ